MSASGPSGPLVIYCFFFPILMLSPSFFSIVLAGGLFPKMLDKALKFSAQGHNTVPLVRLKPATLQFQIEHATTKSLSSSILRPEFFLLVDLQDFFSDLGLGGEKK